MGGSGRKELRVDSDSLARVWQPTPQVDAKALNPDPKIPKMHKTGKPNMLKP